MTENLPAIQPDTQIVDRPTLADVAGLADDFTANNAFTEYQKRRAANTLRRQRNDLALLSSFIAKTGAHVGNLYEDPRAWADISHGLVETFVLWQIEQGYAIGSVNVSLSTVKQYASLAVKAHTLDVAKYAAIKLVKGYRQKEKRNIDEAREITRIGAKKADPVIITKEQAAQLKRQPSTPQGLRDALLVCLLLDHGLRCGEIADLSANAISLTDGTLKFYRRKVDLEQTHELTRDTLVAASQYFHVWQPSPYLLLGSRKGGALVGRMSARAITDRMRVLCQRIGVEGASAHDGRHAWATFAILGETDIKSLQDAGGWKSPAMPLRYAASHKIANKGVKLAN